MSDHSQELLVHIGELVKQGCTSGYSPTWSITIEPEEKEEGDSTNE